jgi:hypothetical protein
MYNSYASLNCTVSQIHISQGITPKVMTISWLTPDDCYSHVMYGQNKEKINNYVYGWSTNYNFTYGTDPSTFYKSGYIHHVQLDSLTENTLYYYKCGDSIHKQDKSMSPILHFTTLPRISDNTPIIFGIIGDLGQTQYSQLTVNHLNKNKDIAMILHVGDLSYADCKQNLWDTYSDMIQPVSNHIPWMVCPGNHEIEFDGIHYDKLYMAFEKRYRMPQIRPAEFGDVIIPSAINQYTGLPYCTPSVFQSEYNYGNSFYSFESGLAHIIYLNPYSNTNKTSVQYKWLEHDLLHVDRNNTPWIIVIMHCPWYNSNKNHYADMQTIMMRDSMEELFYTNNVNIVFSGHVHAYERSYPVYKNNTDSYGTVYITIGDGGNLEGLDNVYYEQPKWSAFRNGSQYGYGTTSIINKNTLVWKWYRNIDNQMVFKDELVLCNSVFGNTKCLYKF